MDFGIRGKVALVLGAGGGLGGAIAHALVQEDAVVAIADVSEDALKTTSDHIQAAGGRSFARAWDLARIEAIEENVAAIERELGAIEILVNNTGGPPPTPAAGQSANLWREQFEAMVLSVITLTDRVLPGMRSRGWGRVITSTSSGVISPIANLAISNTLRSSLVGWSKTLAREVGRDGITANVILPGRIATSRIQSLDEARAKREGRDLDAVQAESTSSIPVGRYGQPEEYGAAVAFLASQQASYITGSIIRVDGGLITSV